MRRWALALLLALVCTSAEASGPLASGLALFVSCNESSDGSVQVDRADSSGNGRTFTDVNTTPSTTATAGHPYANQCLPSRVTSERLTRTDDAGLQIGSGAGWTAAMWLEVSGTPDLNSIIYGRYNAGNQTTSSFAFYFSTTAAINGLTVDASQNQNIGGAIAFTASKRFLVILQKATGSSVLTLHYRNFDAGSWTTTNSGAVGQTNAGTAATTIGASAQPAGWTLNTKLGPVMYWPTRLLDAGDRDALFNGGSGLTFAQMAGGSCTKPGVGAPSVGQTSVGRTAVGATSVDVCH